jgi:hypothetical protein
MSFCCAKLQMHVDKDVISPVNEQAVTHKAFPPIPPRVTLGFSFVLSLRQVD